MRNGNALGFEKSYTQTVPQNKSGNGYQIVAKWANNKMATTAARVAARRN